MVGISKDCADFEQQVRVKLYDTTEFKHGLYNLAAVQIQQGIKYPQFQFKDWIIMKTFSWESM